MKEKLELMKDLSSGTYINPGKRNGFLSEGPYDSTLFYKR
jgi:hypothetical protein